MISLLFTTRVRCFAALSSQADKKSRKTSGTRMKDYWTKNKGPCRSLSSGEQGWRSGESARLPPMCPGPGVICGLSIYSAPRGFSPGTPVFPSHQKPTLVNSNSIWKQWMKSHLVEMPLQNPIIIIIIIIYNRSSNLNYFIYTSQ